MLEQLNVTLIRYEKWKNSQLSGNDLQRFPLHWFGRDEFIMFLRENGFRNITLCVISRPLYAIIPHFVVLFLT